MTIEIELDERTLRPGGVVRGTLTLAPPVGDEGKTVELSVLWQTAGKGDVDHGVVFSSEHEGHGSFPFEAPLPLLPLSYDGNLISITWLVRARRLRPITRDDVVEEPFTMDVK